MMTQLTSRAAWLLLGCLFWDFGTVIATESSDWRNASSPAAQCLDARHHKPEPDSQGELHQLCSPWNEYSCCHSNTSQSSHWTVNHYGFNLSHCGPMHERCRRFFHLDLCYYECDPYIKPWIVKMSRSIGRERILSVPLCADQCEEWWDACRDTHTCVRNWSKHFAWQRNQTGNANRTNVCPQDAECQPFHMIYRDAKDFCETIWDNSWLVVPNSRQCIQFYFKPPNPNKAVAEWYLHTSQSTDSWSMLAIILLIVFALAFYFFNRS